MLGAKEMAEDLNLSDITEQDVLDINQNSWSWSSLENYIFICKYTYCI